MARRLPIYSIEGDRYYYDDRLKEYRHVDRPHDVISEMESVILVLAGGKVKKVEDEKVF